MKTLIISLTAAAIMTAVVASSGCQFDASVLLGIGFSAGFLGLFARDYDRVPRYDLESKKAPATQPARVRPEPRAAATFVIFNTTAA
jgi:hypothetical protein